MPSTATSIGRSRIRVPEVNREAKSDGAAFFHLCDDKYETKIETIAQKIAENPNAARLIMLSGPSASGKTTTSLKLQASLHTRSCGAVTISMDDFFRNREDAPLLPDGTRDYESAAALDTDLLRACLKELIEKGRTDLPVFDFKNGRRKEQPRTVTVDEGHVALVEGLHALDPAITGLLPPHNMLRLYVSVSSDFVGEGGDEVLCARDVRLVRRAVRDRRFRGASVAETLSMWDAVCRGEDLYVRPFKKYADITVNSAFSCEPCIFREKAIGLFSEVPKESPYFEKAAHILKGLRTFEPLPESMLPGSCVLREFLGGSEYY